MNPFLIAALAACAVALPAIVVIAGVIMPVARSYIDANLTTIDTEKLKGAVHGAALIVAEIAKATVGFPLDDGLAQVLEIADREFQKAHGRPLTEAEKARALNIALAIHADPTKPNVRLGAGPINLPALNAKR